MNVFQVLLAEFKKTGKLYAVKALKKRDIVTRDEVDRWVDKNALNLHAGARYVIINKKAQIIDQWDAFEFCLHSVSLMAYK